MTDKPAILGGRPIFTEFVPIVRPYLPKYEDVQAEMEEMISTASLTKGRHLRNLEDAMARHLGVRHAVAMSSCTLGLYSTFLGLGLEGEVVVPSFTFMATVSSLVLAGLKPVFVDVDPHSMNMDPATVEEAITSKTDAIVVVHTFGNPADMDGLEALARKKGLPLLFDSAHGFGSLYRGRRVGCQGKVQVFSLTPTKLVVGGEGGIVATDDSGLAERLIKLREYGMTEGYDSAFAGLNARLPEFNAMMAMHSLGLLEESVSRRNRLAELFREQLGRLPGVGFQQIHPDDRSSYKDFSITVDPDLFGMNRNQLAEALEAENIDSRKYYFPPVHLQQAYRRYHDGRDLPNTERLADRILSLPMWSHMPDEMCLRICEAVARVRSHASEVKRLLGS
ncbi:DegT/DnrJ/EryC1/StrS family aminotransferase [Thermodesulfobacteriota bacterium]